MVDNKRIIKGLIIGLDIHSKSLKSRILDNKKILLFYGKEWQRTVL